MCGLIIEGSTGSNPMGLAYDFALGIAGSASGFIASLLWGVTKLFQPGGFFPSLCAQNSASPYRSQGVEGPT
ncbi:MAG TPA: hypothetical protein VF074_18305 [Pyrinomonadaceae bacterium]